jgi:saccharopine dehydrogenase-like NADP-dependent oxidoreductase
MEGNKKEKIVVIGAGPVGTLAALYAAQRGHDVEVYELRNGTYDRTFHSSTSFCMYILFAHVERGTFSSSEKLSFLDIFINGNPSITTVSIPKSKILNSGPLCDQSRSKDLISGNVTSL